MSDWDKVLAATDGHNMDTVQTHLSDGTSWFAVMCSCGEWFREEWEFTDHIRRLVFDALTPRTETSE